MCGIAGIFHADGARVEESLLHSMAGAMCLRGPDGEGFFHSEAFGLAHRRLSVIDLETGAQPLFNEDGSIAAVVNGEFYNFPELRRELEAKGHHFRTRSDSECAVHLYEEYGTDFVSHLWGMFALAVVDLRKKKILLARDRAGQKPLFYFFSGGVFAFASELNALKQHPNMPREMDMQAVWDYLSFFYIPSPNTVYKGVRKLPPAHCLVFGTDMPEPILSRYWRPDYSEKKTISEADAAQQLRALMRDSVRRRLVADVPTGVFLSGGMDSTIIAALASMEESSEPLNCYSIAFPDKAYDERIQAGRNASFLSSGTARKIQFHVKTVDPEDFTIFEHMVHYYGEPYADASLIPTALLCRFAREDLTVALSGDGADELFGGYDRYFAMNCLNRLAVLPRSVRRTVFGGISRLLAGGWGERSMAGRFARMLHAASLESDENYFYLVTALSEPLKQSLCTVSGAGENSLAYFDRVRKTLTASDPTEQMLELDFHTYLPNDILAKVDTASMSNSLEVRSPFLDHRVVEFAASLPLSLKLHGRQRKYLLARAFGDCLPPELPFARKKGFGVPLAAWFRGAWREPLNEHLLDGALTRKIHLFRRDRLESLIRDHESGRADHSRVLYTLLALDLFLEQ